MDTQESMYDCYKSQIKCLRNIFDAKDALLDKFYEFYTLRRPDRLLLVGSGTSFHACSASAAYLESCLGIEVSVKTPSAPGNIYGERPLAIAVSQSGRSTNTIEVIKTLKNMNIPVVTLTDPIDTPVGREGDLALLLAAEDETIGPKTRGYMATMFMLHLMALEMGRQSGHISEHEYDTDMKHLDALIEKGPGYLVDCEAFFNTHLDALIKAGQYLFVGTGVSANAANEGALKVLETICCPAAGYEFEEFLHGPIFCANASLALFFFLSDDDDAERMLKTAALLNQATDNVYIISHKCVNDVALPESRVLYLPCEDKLRAFAGVLFPQLISAKLPEIMGRVRHAAVRDVATELSTKA